MGSRYALAMLTAGLTLAAPAAAQTAAGRLEVTAADGTGSVLPGVVVSVTGPEDRTAVADGSGQAHFFALAPGIYTVRASHPGFAEYVNRHVPVRAGHSLSLRIVLAVSGVTHAVEVTAAVPAVDPKQMSVSAAFTASELQRVPSARDPWVILQMVPGVVVDRVNVGGTESGQQSHVIAKGASQADNVWILDGVPITDMAATGASPMYFDFGMFDEVHVTTGGASLEAATPGVAIHLVLKSGTNTPRGSGRFYFTGEPLQATNIPPHLVASLGGPAGTGNRMEDYREYGIELGGPIVRNRLWAWGALGKTSVTVRTFTGTPDSTALGNVSLKGTWQTARGVRSSLAYYRSDKQKHGRDASPVRPPETSYDQKGPFDLFKAEAGYAPSGNLFLTARWAHVSSAFLLSPLGGLDADMIGGDDAGIARNSFYQYSTNRPQQSGRVEATYFRGRHEVTAAVSHRRAAAEETYTVPGSGVITYHSGYPGMIAEVTAWNRVADASARYTSAAVTDTLSFDRLTIRAGVRWDRQAASVAGHTQRGSTLLPALLPDLTGQAARDAIVWKSLTPRIGATYALGAARRLLARAGYSAFPSQMSAVEASFFSTAGSMRGVYFFDVFDRDRDGVADAGDLEGRTCTEAEVDRGACAWYGFDFANPGGPSAHRIGRYSTPTTHEATAGVDYEVMPDVGVSATLTWRRFTGFNWRQRQGLDGTDFVQLDTLSGSVAPVGPFSVPIYGLPAGTRAGTATEYVTRPDYRQRYWGLEVAATKRLSNRWMARLGFSANDHREHFGSRRALGDPTPTLQSPGLDGGHVMRTAGGSGKSGIYMILPAYQVAGTGAYEAGWGVRLAASLLVRQGYAMPYYRSLVRVADASDSLKSVLLAEVGAFRLPPVASLDIRAGKQWRRGSARISLDLDVFNLPNLATVLRREYDLRLTAANRVLEIVSPRIVQLGLRISR